VAGVGEVAEAWLIRGDWGWERLLGFAVDKFAKVEGSTSMVSVGYSLDLGSGVLVRSYSLKSPTCMKC
jgi:hypothetical protein